MKNKEQIRTELLSMADIDYKKFLCPLIPTLEPERVIGIRAPQMKKYASALVMEGYSEDFLRDLPHRYLEEDSLHAYLIAGIKDYDECIEALDVFLPYIDNWAVCDGLSPKCFERNLHRLSGDIERWIFDKERRCYVIRFGLGMLMNHYLGDEFKAEYLDMAASVKSGEYYVNMMIAWFFATALAKQYEATLPYISENRLPDRVHNKSIQKAVESRRISEEQKAYLKTLKIKTMKRGDNK